MLYAMPRNLLVCVLMLTVGKIDKPGNLTEDLHFVL